MAQYPRLQVFLREVVPSSLSDDMLAGRYDVAIMFYPGPIRGLETRAMHSEHLWPRRSSRPSRHPRDDQRRTSGRRALDRHAARGRADVACGNLEAAPTIEQVAVWKPGNLNPTLWLFLQAAGIVRNSGVPPHGVAPITVAAIAVGREVGNLCYRSSLSECHRNLLHFIGFEPT